MAATAKPVKPVKKQVARPSYEAIPPQPKNRVEDPGRWMSAEARKALDTRLRQWQVDTGHELGVYIGKTTGKVPRGHWCLVAFNAWGMGRKDKDDGIVLFIFTEEGRPGRGGWWVTVGFGMEKYITDAEATRIVRSVPVAALDYGDKDKAVNDVVDALLAEIGKH